MNAARLIRTSVGILAVLSAAACHRGANPSGTPAAAKAAATPPAPKLPAGVTLAMIAEGDSLFHARSCVRCHGAKAVGGPNAMRARGGMQPLLTDSQVNAIASYVWSLNHPTQ